MAINTQKFLPSSSSIVKSSSTEVSKFLAPNTSLAVYKDTNEIKVKAIEVDKLLKNNLLLSSKENKENKKEKENEKRREKESLLEKKKDFKNPEKALPTMPKVGILDSIKRFLFFTFLGVAFTKFNKYLPEIILFTKKIEPVAKFLEDFSGNILNGMITFIDWGYKASDATRGFLKDVGGDSTAKLFDRFTNSLNDFVNAAIVFGILASKKPTPRGGFGGKGGRINVDASGRKVSGGVQKRYLRRFGEKQFVDRFGTKNLNRVVKQQFGKRAARLVGKSFGRIPIIGGLIDFVINLSLGEDPGRAAAKAVGATTGAALGTLVPIPGVGTILGGILGDIVGGALYDTIAGPKQPKKAHAQGGSIAGAAGSTRRSIRVQRQKPQKVLPQKTIPGKDVGGIKQISRLYGEDTNPKLRTPLRALKKTSASLKKVPLFGNLMGASIDLAMGQRPDKRMLQNVGNSFGAFIQGVIDNNITSSLGDITNMISGLAGGGIVPRSIQQQENYGMSIGKLIGQAFSTKLDARVNEIFSALRSEMLLEGAANLDPAPPFTPGAMTPDQAAAFNYIKSIAKKVGSPNPDVTAAIAMWETGWLSNPNSVYFASGKTNPFGQTGEGPRGSVIGKDGQKHAVYNSIEEGVKAHVDRWKSSYIGNSPEQIIENIRQGKGRGAPGMYNTNPGWSQNVLSMFKTGTQPAAPTNLPPGLVPDGVSNGRLRKSQLKSAGTLYGSKDSWGGNTVYLLPAAADAFIRAKNAAAKEGITILVTSAYRDYAHQARVAADPSSYTPAAPGTSRHGYGIALDIQTGTPGYSWFVRNGPSYGWYYMAFPGDPVHFEFRGQPGALAKQQKRQRPVAARQTPTAGRIIKSTSLGPGYVLTIRQGQNGKKLYYLNGQPISESEANVYKKNHPSAFIASSVAPRTSSPLSQIGNSLAYNTESPNVVVLVQPVEKEIIKPVPISNGGNLIAAGGVNTLIPQGLMQS
jgi:hypothetical protein